MSASPSVIQEAVCSREALGDSGIRVLCARSRAARKSINPCCCSGGSASSFGNARSGSRARTMNSWFLSAIGWRCFGQNRGGLFDEPVRHGGFMRLPEDFMQGFAWGQVLGFLVNRVFPFPHLSERAGHEWFFGFRFGFHLPLPAARAAATCASNPPAGSQRQSSLRGGHSPDV